ncbi:uncharacterized protein TNCV_3504341 [Trichonephila clavipes]|uniref:Uncharacterized protein n=1 Tax=Trichonephila clavipes TaxID=2585209 RepID=A0A8X6V7V0_TRICX|nr:uncharacterized protein TNCV_3504341 [Trichonephila clavipes]
MHSPEPFLLQDVARVPQLKHSRATSFERNCMRVKKVIFQKALHIFKIKIDSPERTSYLNPLKAPNCTIVCLHNFGTLEALWTPWPHCKATRRHFESHGQILFEDEDMPFTEGDDELLGECTQSFLEALQEFKDLLSQLGNGLEVNAAAPSRSDFWTPLETDGNCNILIAGLITDQPLLVKIRKLLETLLQRVISSLEPTDLIRAEIFSEHLDRTISTHLMLVSEMSVEKIMACATKVLQSKSEVRLDEGFNIEIITIRRPVGSGKRNRRVLIPSIDRLRKTSIRYVPDDDLNICCAKAIILAIAEVEKDADLRQCFSNCGARPPGGARAYRKEKI